MDRLIYQKYTKKLLVIFTLMSIPSSQVVIQIKKMILKLADCLRKTQCPIPDFLFINMSNTYGVKNISSFKCSLELNRESNFVIFINLKVFLVMLRKQSMKTKIFC